MLKQKIKIAKYNNIVVLTGAGISVASGLPTYRGKETSQRINTSELAHIDRLKDNPQVIWQVFNSLRQDCQAAKPNPAHVALVNLEKQIELRQNFTILTQNVDRLHQQAGNKNVVELHGRIDRTCCSNSGCDFRPFLDTKIYPKEAPFCPQCDCPLKPDVLLFGAAIPLNIEWQVKKALRNCDLFIAIGTSGTVFPAAN